MDDDQASPLTFVGMASEIVAATHAPESPVRKLLFTLARMLDDPTTDADDTRILTPIFTDALMMLCDPPSSEPVVPREPALPPANETTRDWENLSPEDRESWLKRNGLKSEDWRDEDILFAMGVGIN